MYCIKCNEELETDDNYCPKCGELTSHGYIYFQNHPNAIKPKENNIGQLFTLTSIIIITFTIVALISGKDIFRPYLALKKEIYSLKYGYNISLMNTTNIYNNIEVNTREEAINLIKEDLQKTSWQCKNNVNVKLIEKEISENYDIPSVSLCDVDEHLVGNIQIVIDKIYKLFPNIKGYLTNITITNAKAGEDYIAYFEPLYTFVNPSNDINNYNKVNKTQILLNSYYFLNKDILNSGLKENWYPDNATYESLIAHELGHYITFVTLLKTNNITDITLITKDNINNYQIVQNTLNTSSYSKELVEKAISNYNINYNTSITISEFAGQISSYAKQETLDKVLNYDEIIAEAIHDYYLHEENSSKSTLEIISVIKERLR